MNQSLKKRTFFRVSQVECLYVIIKNPDQKSYFTVHEV